MLNLMLEKKYERIWNTYYNSNGPLHLAVSSAFSLFWFLMNRRVCVTLYVTYMIALKYFRNFNCTNLVLCTAMVSVLSCVCVCCMVEIVTLD